MIAFFGHHKAGTTWIQRICVDVCRDLSLRYAYMHHPQVFGHDLRAHCSKNKIDFFTYSNANSSKINNFDEIKGFHVIRDPRDIIVSAYYSHKNSHPTKRWPSLIKHREALKRVSKEEGLFMELEFAKGPFIHVGTWDYSRDNIYEIKMEALLANQHDEFLKIFKFLGVIDSCGDDGRESLLKGKLAATVRQVFGGCARKMPAQRLLEIVHNNRFQKLSKGRSEGQENPYSHFRKGIAGDWVNHFDDQLKMEFKNRYGDLLIKLGYEQDSNW